MKQVRNRRQGRFCEINMTPLMDLTFLLLITFIITFPAMEQGISVKLPKGSADVLPSKKAQTVTLDEKGGLYLNNQGITFEELERQLGVFAAEDPNTAVLVRADSRLEYGAVMKIMKALYKVRLTRISLVTLAD